MTKPSNKTTSPVQDDAWRKELIDHVSDAIGPHCIFAMVILDADSGVMAILSDASNPPALLADGISEMMSRQYDDEQAPERLH